jgi:hypothetical protein
MTRTRERHRLEGNQHGRAPWQRWGTYVSDRVWGTVREDYGSVLIEYEAATWDPAKADGVGPADGWFNPSMQ